MQQRLRLDKLIVFEATGLEELDMAKFMIHPKRSGIIVECLEAIVTMIS